MEKLNLVLAIAPLVGAGLITGGASLLGGLLGNNSASKEAQKNREFQERMAKNAHQYEVEDLRKAGLNPILSGLGGQGASTPGGATANVKDPITPAISSALQAQMTEQQLKNIGASTDKLNVEKGIAEETYRNQWTTNNMLFDEPFSQLELGVKNGTAKPYEIMQWNNIRSNIANTSAVMANTTLAEQQAELNKPELEFNKQTGNSAVWLKNLMQFIKALK